MEKLNEKSLIGKTVSLDSGGDFSSVIEKVSREIINFEGEEDNNYKIELKNEESYFIHSSAFDDFLNGEDTGAYLKSNYKGGTIMLIKEENKTMDAKSKYADLKNEVLNVGLIQSEEYLDKENGTTVLAITPIKEDVTVFIIEKNGNELGVNYSWGGFEIIQEKDPLITTIDSELTNKVNWNGHPKDIIKSITKAIEADIINKQNQNNPEMKKTTEEQITYLKDFIIRWNAMEDLMDDGERFLVNGNLQSEYDSFLTDNELEALSADDLLIELEVKFEEDNKEEEIELEEKNAFNDVDIFIEEYKNYLIGKKITYGKGEKIIIRNVVNYEESIGLELSNDDVDSFEIDYAKNFIDGEEIHSTMGDISLLIQEEKETKEEEKISLINSPENRYFVYNSKTGYILSGHEYREDAISDFDYRVTNLGEKDLNIFNKKELPVDPNDDSNWNLSLSDYSIIKEAIDFGITEGDYDVNAASAYFEKYKSESKFSSVIKARLVIYMEHCDKHFKNAVISSQYEKALRFKETKEKLMNELLNIIKKDI